MREEFHSHLFSVFICLNWTNWVSDNHVGREPTRGCVPRWRSERTIPSPNLARKAQYAQMSAERFNNSNDQMERES